MKMEIPAQAIGKTVLEVNFRARFDLNIIAIENGGKLVEVIKPDYVFREGDMSADLEVSPFNQSFCLLRLNAWAEN